MKITVTVTTFWQWLTVRMAEKGLGVGGLAEACGVTRQTLWYWRVHGSSPRVRAAKGLAEVFGVPIGEIIDAIDSSDVDRTHQACQSKGGE